MKKIIATLAIIFSLTTSAIFAAGGTSVSESILKSFNEEFSGAENASWRSLDGGLYHVSFDYEATKAEAFFDEAGELVATGRNITQNQLPLMVSKGLKSKYDMTDVRIIIEYSIDSDTQYLVSFNNGMELKASSNGDIQVYKKVKNAK